jgi:hypothetical protein
MQAPMTDEDPSTRSRREAPTCPRHAPAAPVTDASADQIRGAEKRRRRRVEDMLRDELRRRWVAPAEEFARLQIARLDGMILKLIGRIEDGDLEAIDCALTIVESLDRHPKFPKPQAAAGRYTDEERERLIRKLNDLCARLQSEKAEE